MIRKISLVLLLAPLLFLLFWQLETASAQTGAAKGEVKLVTNTNGQRVVETKRGVAICVVSANVFDENFDCAKCNEYGANCHAYRTDPQGQFTTQQLSAPQTWYFIPRKQGYTPREIGVYEIIVDKLKEINPPPLWLDMVGALGRGRGDSARLPTRPDATRGRAQAFITLALYGGAGPQDFSGGTGQPTVILAGTVMDTQSQPLQGASVFVSDFSEQRAATKSALVGKTLTNSNGRFTLEIPSKLDEGTYLFSVTLEGFRPFITSLSHAVTRLKETGGATAAANGEGTDNIILTRKEELHEKSDPLVETLEATRRHVFTPEVMQTLPVQGTRSFDEFALLAPGVLPPPETFGGVGPGVSAGVGTAGQFSVNGLRSRENNFTIDGSDNNDEDIGTRRQGFIMTVPQPVESVQELQVITALGDARFGRNIGGQINALTKTGGVGRFHGSLYAYLTDSHLNAREPFDQTATAAPPVFTPRRASDNAPVLLDSRPLALPNPVGGKDQYRRAQLGLAAGGQLKRYDETFYFISAERQDIRADRESHFAVPTVKQRGAFESGDAGLLLLTGQNSQRQPLYPASVPGDAIFSLFPFPNNPLGPYGENTYSSVLPADGHGTRFSIKLDHQFKGEPPTKVIWVRTLFSRRAHIDQLTGRYNFTDELSTLPVTGGALFSSLRPKVRTQNLAFFVNRSLSPSTSDTIRFSFGRTRLFFGERRDASMLPSSALPDTQFLLNAPLLLNVTRPNADGTLNAPSFVSAASPFGSSLLGSLGYQSVTQTEQLTGPLGQVLIAGFSPIGVDVENFPQERANNTYQLADTITSVHERHVYTFGVDMRKTRINSTLDRNFRPSAVFNGLPGATFGSTVERPGGGTQVQTGVLTGATLAAAGVPTGLFQALATIPDSSIGIRFTQVNLFAQDQWRMRARLHLTAGMRYELNTVPDTVGQRLENAFDPEQLRTQAQQVAQGFCVPHARCNDLVGALTSAFPADFKVSFGSDRNDFDARLGFAWVPPGLGATSIRGGFGTYSGQFPGIVIDQSRNAFSDFLPLNLANFTPRSGNQTFLFNLANPAVRQLSPGLRVITPGTLNQFPSVNPIAFLANQIFDLSSLSLSPTALGLDLVLPQRKLKAPYALQYGLSVEHQFRNDYLLSAAYIGTRGVKLLRIATPDLGLNDSRFAGPVTLSPLTTNDPFPFFQGQIRPPQANLISQSFAIARTFFESSSRSSYDSLQMELRKRYSHAFLIGSALTYSHSIDDVSDFFDNAGDFALPQNSLRRDERASSNFDVRLRSVTHFVLDFQKEWFGSGWFSSVFGGFQLSGVFTTQTGQPYTVNSALDINSDGNLTDRLDTNAGIISDPAGGRIQLRLAPGVNTRDLLAPDGFDGTVGRNTFRAPGLSTFDLALTHTIPLRDHSRFVVRAEFFNLFNRANYGIPVRILESPAFGASVSTRTPPRMIQLVGKFQF